MAVCDCLKHIYGWVCLSRQNLWMNVAVKTTFMGGSAFIEYLYGWVWVGATVKIIFMGGCTFLEYIYE